MRRRFKQTASLQERLSEFANAERAKAEGMPESAERYDLLKKVKPAECVATIEAWANARTRAAEVTGLPPIGTQPSRLH